MLDLLKTPKATAASLTNNSAKDDNHGGPKFVPLRIIQDNPYQPRGHYDAEHILNLALSIKRLKADVPTTLGLQQIPLARSVGQQVQLMFGHSRLRAFMVLAEGLRRLGDGSGVGLSFASVNEKETRFAELLDPDPDYAVMPVMIAFALDNAMWQHAITENSQRKNITAMEEARTMQRAIDEFGLTTEEAGKPFGYQRSTSANKLRLLNLPPEVQTAIDAGDLTERHGRELLRLADDPERLRLAAEDAIKKGKTVRQLAEQVGWSEQAMKQAQEKARQLEAARAAIRNGWRTPANTEVSPRCVQDIESYKANIFDSQDAADRILVEQNGCGPQCGCFVLAYVEHRAERGYHPDPENAPKVCMACTDWNAISTQRRALGTIEDTSDEGRAKREAAAAKKQQIEAMNNEAHTVWQGWLKDQDKHALWNSLAFWKVASASDMRWGMEASIRNSPDVQTACGELLKSMYRNTRSYNSDLGESVHTVAEVERLIKSLGVSRETGEDAGIEQIIEEGETHGNIRGV